jgi:L-gulonolactone oxidase
MLRLQRVLAQLGSRHATLTATAATAATQGIIRARWIDSQQLAVVASSSTSSTSSSSIALNPTSSGDESKATTRSKEEEDLKIVMRGRNAKRRTWHNWADNQHCTPRYWHAPANIAEVQSIVRHAARHPGEHVKIVGEGHSPSDIACTESHLVTLRKLNRVLHVDRKRSRCTVEGGILLSELNTALDAEGMALSCLGSISDQTLAGAVCTGTHGTGITYGVISSTVLSLDLVTVPHGALVHCSRTERPQLFQAALCSLGALGVLVRITIQCEPAFQLECTAFPRKLEWVLQRLDSELLHSAEHFRFWWFPHTDNAVVTQMNRTTQKKPTASTSTAAATVRDKLRKFVGFQLLEFLLFVARLAPSRRLSPVPLINKLYFALLFNRRYVSTGRSHEVFNFDCLFKQFVTEWSIPATHTATALRELQRFVASEKLNVHFPVEVRFVKADNIWLSPAYGRDSCYINIISYRPYGTDYDYARYFAGFERIMLRHSGRPHWAKIYNLSPATVHAMYPKWRDFAAVRRRMDPHGVFSNAYLQKLGFE